MLVLNRDFGETIQRIHQCTEGRESRVSSMAALQERKWVGHLHGHEPASKEDVASIRHLYLDLDHGGRETLRSIENSNVVPEPSYVLTSSPGKFQIVWKVEGMSLDEAEGLLRAMAREFGGDPAATDATRVLRLPGFANKKYETDFNVEARKESTKSYHLSDFKLPIYFQDSPRHNYHDRAEHTLSSRSNLSQSEHDWAFAKRALARGEDPEAVICQIAQHRAHDKSDPQYYARLTVVKAQVDLVGRSSGHESPTEEQSKPKEIGFDH